MASHFGQVPLVVLVADPGPYPDDVKGILLAAHFHFTKRLKFLGVICCGGGESERRARLAKRILELCYPKLNIPVAIGSQGSESKRHTPAPHEYDIDGFAQTTTKGMPKGTDLLLSLLKQAKDRSVTIVVQAAFTDVADVLKENPDLFLKKVARVCAMGGIKDPANVTEPWLSDASFNNDLDEESANAVYQFCQTKGIPLSILGRDAVPPLSMTKMREVASRSNNHPAMVYLSQAQDGGLVALWGRVCRKELPPSCDKKWFFVTFCGVSADDFPDVEGQYGGTIPDDVDIRKLLHGTVKPYDPMTVMMTVDRSISTRWYDWEKSKVVGPDGVEHNFFQTIENVHCDAILKDIMDILFSASSEGTTSDCAHCFM